MVHSGTVGGKTSKTLVLPGFSKIEWGSASNGAPHCYGGLSKSGQVSSANGTAGPSFGMTFLKSNQKWKETAELTQAQNLTHNLSG